MSVSFVIDDGQGPIKFYAEEQSAVMIHTMMKSLKNEIKYFALHIGSVTLRISDCHSFVTQLLDYPALSSTLPSTLPTAWQPSSMSSLSTMSPNKIDQFLQILSQQHKQTIIISILFIVLFLLLFTFIVRKTFRIIQKKTSNRALSHNNSIELSTKHHLRQHREDLEELPFSREFNDHEQQI